jgi:hypothetical protein
MHAGRDLVLAVAQQHGADLPHGVALDDFLSPVARIAVDADAHASCQRWRAARARALTLEGVDLTSIWEQEMLAQCFLPAARLLHALPSALRSIGGRRLVIRDLDRGTAGLVRLMGSSLGVTVKSESDTSPTRDPIGRKPARLIRAVNRTGVPPRVRGEVVCMPYWPMYPAIAALARSPRGLRPVAARLLLPGLGLSRALAVAASGGWVGLPDARLCAASRSAVSSAICRARAGGSEEDPTEAAVDAYALETLSRIAGETLAHVWHARRALAGGGVRLGLIPFDSVEHARMLLAVMDAAEIPSLLLQHGWYESPGEPEMSLARYVAIWSERARPSLPDRDPLTVTVTGNPGAAHLAVRTAARPACRGRSIILVDYPGRLSSRAGSRVGMRHVAAALEAVAAVRPRTRAVIRPHPSDLCPDAYLQLRPARGELEVEIDAQTAIEPLLASADLCVGSLSTATLQACALGVPTVVLDIAGIERPWPFCKGALSVSTQADELAEAIAAVLASREIPGCEAALDALGVHPDATDRVVDLAIETAR